MSCFGEFIDTPRQPGYLPVHCTSLGSSHKGKLLTPFASHMQIVNQRRESSARPHAYSLANPRSVRCREPGWSSVKPQGSGVLLLFWLIEWPKLDKGHLSHTLKWPPGISGTHQPRPMWFSSVFAHNIFCFTAASLPKHTHDITGGGLSSTRNNNINVTMADKSAAERACKEPNPIIDGRKANVNLAYLGAKPRQNGLAMAPRKDLGILLQGPNRLALSVHCDPRARAAVNIDPRSSTSAPHARALRANLSEDIRRETSGHADQVLYRWVITFDLLLRVVLPLTLSSTRNSFATRKPAGADNGRHYKPLATSLHPGPNQPCPFVHACVVLNSGLLPTSPLPSMSIFVMGHLLSSLRVQ
ncbi:hypothetical protein RRG08_013864 [Elysia crispata]|uniref:RNA-binding protein 38 n=1 Tax=Elysia crispata TaxID=231223 RepID=A0AAE0YKV7_9GAST|nr:hypothetical protein RRG08_013864 [Elysia crispata]